MLHQLYVGPVASQSLTLDLWKVPDPDESDIVATNQIGRSKAPPNYSSHVWQNTCEECQKMLPNL